VTSQTQSEASVGVVEHCLHKFRRLHIDKDLKSGTLGFREDELFFNCDFNDLRGVTLKDCDLNGSRFHTDKVQDALGFTMTLDCKSFDNVEYSPFLFDLLLVLMMKTKGNDSKRRKLLQVLGEDRAREILTQLKGLE
jgi:hypothetical protein